MAKFRLRKNIDPMRLTRQITLSVIGLWVASTVVGVLLQVVNTSNTDDPFYLAYKFMGLVTGTTGVITIAGIMVAIQLLYGVMDITW